MKDLNPTSYIALGEKTSPKFCAAFAKGCGGHTADNSRVRPGPVAMFGSPQVWNIKNQAIAEGRDLYYGDHGYFGREEYYRITKNRMQHTGSGWAPSHRFNKFGIEIKPWRTRGSHILLCPPDQIFASLMGFDAYMWERNVRQILHQYTDRAIITRRKNSMVGPLKEDINNCWALVTYMSNVAVDALLEGIPIFCTGMCASSLMGSNDLSKIETPEYHADRGQWAANLAVNQWTLEEIESGECWETLK